MRALSCVIICVQLSAWKRRWFPRYWYSIILSIPVVWKKLCWCTERVYFVSLNHFYLKSGEFKQFVATQNCFREQVSRLQIFATSKNFYFDQRKLLPWLFVFFATKRHGSRQKLNLILRRRYGFVMTALGENIFRIGLRRFATPPNTEYMFSQLAVIIKP